MSLRWIVPGKSIVSGRESGGKEEGQPNTIDFPGACATFC